MRKIKSLCFLPLITFTTTPICSCSFSTKYEIKFYCGNTLVSTEQIKQGKKIINPDLDYFIVQDWYLDEQLTNKFDLNTPIQSNLVLYGKYKNKVTYSNKYSPLELDSYGNGVSSNKLGEIYVSNCELDNTSFIKLKDRGITFNKTSLGKINSININIKNLSNSNCVLYCGDRPLSFQYSFNLQEGLNNIDLTDKDIYYFVIQSLQDDLYVESFYIQYESTPIPSVDELPIVSINTNGKEITSKEEYVESYISTKDTTIELDNVLAGIRIRGNSTSELDKKPYRIKFDKKQSLFGLEKAKNWVLLADFLDGSKMHNYSALNFAKLVKGDTSFCPTSHHVRVNLNGKDLGIYLLAEHIDEKQGRMNLEQSEIWNFTTLDQFNFMVERDSAVLKESTKVEGRDYFAVEINNSKEYYELKYPTIDDFIETTITGESISHETEFYNYFNMLKEYITNVSNLMFLYKSDTTQYSELTKYIDVNSLAMFGAIDQTLLETDHCSRSFKFYRNINVDQLIKFGPNWDYDIMVMYLPIVSRNIAPKPFLYYDNAITSLYFKEPWSLALYNDETNGRPLFKNIWANISQSDIDNYLKSIYDETYKLLPYYLNDTSMWYSNRYSCVFDNFRYNYEFLKAHITFLKDYYSNL